MNNAAATSRVVIPDAASSATRCSDGVSPRPRAGATAGAVELGAGSLRPQPCAQLLEGGQGLAQHGARVVLLALSTLELAEQQEGAGTFERHRQPVVVGQRRLGRAGAPPTSPCAASHMLRHRAPTASIHGRSSRRPLASSASIIGSASVVAAQRDQRLDRVGDVTRRHDLGAGHLVESRDQRLQRDDASA